MKILNLYAGIGGNRKLWGNDHEITAVEYNEEIAKVYKNMFPDDNVIIADAHQYLLEHYKEYDFIWSSPPCPTHSRLCYSKKNKEYPDMRLWQEIIFLFSWSPNLFCVENVISYYAPLVKPTVELGRHYFWSNFQLQIKLFANKDVARSTPDELLAERGLSPNVFDVIKDVPESRIKGKRFDRRQILRNMVNPELGLYILEQAQGHERKLNLQGTLFSEAI